MPTVANIQNTADAFVATNIAKFQAVQSAYYGAHGRYFQGIITPTLTPDDGTSTPADYTRRPTDQAEQWSDVFTGGNALPGNLPLQIRIDVYDGPVGKGWSVTLIFTKLARTYSRTWNFGPEADRERAWADIT